MLITGLYQRSADDERKYFKPLVCPGERLLLKFLLELYGFRGYSVTFSWPSHEHTVSTSVWHYLVCLSIFVRRLRQISLTDRVENRYEGTLFKAKLLVCRM